MSKSLRVFVVVAVIAGMLASTGLAVANGPPPVDPPAVSEIRYPGESLEVDKVITTPPIPPLWISASSRTRPALSTTP
jgi:hypothetical protein